MASPLELFNEGELRSAIQAAIESVKEQPNDVDSRWMLASLFCFEGNLERGEQHLQTILRQAPDLAADVMLQRNLIRGELVRRQVFSEGRLPEFPEPPPERLKQVIRALALLRAEEQAEASGILSESMEHGPSLSGKCDEHSFKTMRDLDDRTSNFFEVIAATGNYYWVPFEELISVELQPIEEISHVIWRPAKLTNQEHDSYTAYLPGLYVESYLSSDEAIQCGRAADWTTLAGDLICGLGLRCFELDGEETHHFAQISRIEFTRQK